MSIVQRGIARSPAVGSEGLARLYETHVPGAVSLASLLICDHHAAEDLAHEAFLRAAGRFTHLRNPDAFGAYLFRTVVNLCRARARSRRREALGVNAKEPQAPDASRAFVQRDLVWTAIARLPFRQRAAVVLRYYE